MTPTSHAEASADLLITPQETGANAAEVIPVVDLTEFYRACEAKGWRTLTQAAVHLDIQPSWLSKVLNRKGKLGGDVLFKLHYGLRDVTTFEALIKYEVRPAT